MRDILQRLDLGPPDLDGIRCSSGAVSRGELTIRSLAMAETLAAHGLADGATVGIHLTRSPASVIAVLGAARAGVAYVPLDPAWPAARRRLIIEDAGLSAVIVADGDHGEALDWEGLQTITAPKGPARTNPSPLGPVTTDRLNLLYTSGSTGRPKGVWGSRAAMAHRVAWAQAAMPLGADEVVGHRSSMNFVDAGPEIFSAVAAGVPIAVILPEEQADLGRFVEALAQHGVTRLTVVPSLLTALLRSFPDLAARVPRLRTWICSGEALHGPLVAAFFEALPEATLLNLYGSTEITGDVCWHRVTPRDAGGPAPIGRALPDTALQVVDDAGELVADGLEGELWVSGPLLSLGYHDRPMDEAARFPRHPPGPDGVRVFRTGDRVVRDPATGLLHYRGRRDRLIKLRGVRIDLDELRAAILQACPEARDCAVVPALDHLLGMVVAQGVSVEALEAAVQAQLPAPMRPARWLVVAALPTLPNGKVDLAGVAAAFAQERHEAPRTEAERWLCARLAEITGRDAVGLDDSPASLGADSLTMAELMAALEAWGAHGWAAADVHAQTVSATAARLDAPGSPLDDGTAPPRWSLSPPDPDDPDQITMVVEASRDAELCAATYLPVRMSVDGARAWLADVDALVLRVDGAPAGVAAIIPAHKAIGDGVVAPPNSVQLDEWLLPRFRGQGWSDVAWPMIARWLAARYDHEVSVTWADNDAMLAVLRSRGYQRLGRSMWVSGEHDDGSSGACEVWSCDLSPYRDTPGRGP
ncbi:non-ribosomal peptide synthetase [Myxococcota bacterium]|nr:non-ribosomal peptide synthetase [Myxococcota bacterium]